MELNLLFELKIKDNKLEQIRDLFLFGYWTGLRFSDLKRFNSSADIKENIFYIKAQKTQNTVPIPILPVARKILEKYQNILPECSEPTFNKAINNRCKNTSITY